MKLELAGVPSGAGLALELEEECLTFPEGLPLAEVLSQARQKLLRHGWLIENAVLDGLPLTEGEEDRLGGRSSSAFGRLELEVSPIPASVCSTFKGCAESIPGLILLTRRIAKAIRDGKLPQAYRMLQQFGEGLQVLNQAYRNGLELLEVTGFSRGAGLEKSCQGLQQLEADLQEVLAGITRQDHVLISDVLDYELSEHLDTFKKEFLEWSQLLLSAAAR
ncbi:MAG: hypothetical protein HY717_21725 [Planctomycetes bacterium]|nr:hypothetical protein [Planctomycetota bacterium]